MGMRELKGLDRIVLSQAPIYALGNSGRDQGMAIDEVMRILSQYGTTPADVIDPYDWRGYRRRQWPKDWQEKAKPFRGIEWLDLPTYAHMVTAAKLGFLIGFGVRWQGGGGHAIFATKYDSQKKLWVIFALR